MTTREEVSFLSQGVRCAAWHLPAAGDAFAGSAGSPCVVMAHGFGGTRDTGLLAYAEGFAAAGLHVVLFDYRGFGDSTGEPRQRVSYRDQRADYAAATTAARELPGVDPDRIVLWGTSYSGGHVIAVAAADPRIAAVVSLTPAVDGLAALGAIVRRHPTTLPPLIGHGLRDAVGARLGRAPHHLPIVGPPGSTAMITAPGAVAGYEAVAGPTWRNEVCARASLEVALNRPVRQAPRLKAPLLVQVGEHDSVAPPSAALAAAKRAGGAAETRTYPVDHFDVYAGDWPGRVVADQIAFLHRHLHPAAHADSTAPERITDR